MKNGKGKLLSLLLAAVMVISLMPMSVFAATQTSPKIFDVLIRDADGNDIEVSKLHFDQSQNINEATTQESGTIPTGGSFTYDADTYTLTIKDANIRHIGASCWSNDTESVFNLKFVGKNVITQKDDNDPIYLNPNTNITFAEGATLDIHTNSSFGYKASGIQSNLNLTITGGKINIPDSAYLGIVTLNGDLNLKNTEINISVKDGAQAAGIFLDSYEDGVNGTLNSTNSKLNIKADYPAINAGPINLNETEANLESTKDVGIFSNNCTLNSTNSKLNIKAYKPAIEAGPINLNNTEADLESTNVFGIFSKEGIKISDRSKLNVKGQENSIFVWHTIEISDSEFVGTSNDPVLRTYYDNITINNTKLKLDCPNKKLIYSDKNGKILIDDVERTSDDLVGHFATPADYTKLNDALEEAKKLEANKDSYEDFAAVENAIKEAKAIEPNLDFTEQGKIDKALKSLNDAVANLKHKHSPEMIAGKKPTCTEAGWKDYYQCKYCQKFFEDEECKVEIANPEEWKAEGGNGYLPAINHNWGETTYKWSDDYMTCTATRVCGNDSSHTETATATVTSEVTTPATCTEKGETTYTAKFDKDWAAQQTEVVTNVPAINHKWGEPTYKWSDDHMTCTATRVCGNDSSHTETAIATITSEVTTPATCTEKGETTYTAKFDKGWAKPQTATAENVPELKHNWGEPVWNWSEDNTTATVKFVCKNDKKHTETPEVTMTHKTTEPTCTTAGETVYAATVTFNGNTYTDSKTVVIPEIGHKLGTLVKGQAATYGKDGWKDYYKCEDCGKFFEDEACTKEIKDLETWKTGAGKIAKLEYKILDGAGGSWAKNSDGTLTFRANGNFADFTGIEVDGKAVDSKNYEAKAGSTIVTLKKDYLQTLADGSHTLTFVYKDGEVSTNFTVTADTSTPTTEPTDSSDTKNPTKPADKTNPDVPKTGDESNIALWTLLGILSIGGASALLLLNRKRKSSAR